MSQSIQPGQVPASLPFHQVAANESGGIRPEPWLHGLADNALSAALFHLRQSEGHPAMLRQAAVKAARAATLLRRASVRPTSLEG